MYGEIRRWAQRLPVGELVDLDDARSAFPDKSRDALKMALRRLCRGADPLMTRVCRGIYCRRRVGSRSGWHLDVIAVTVTERHDPPLARVHLACGRVAAGARATVEAYGFGVPEGPHPEPWTAAYHRKGLL